LKTARSHVLFPVPRGPNRKNDDFGGRRERVNIDANFAASLVAMSTTPPSAEPRAGVRIGFAQQKRERTTRSTEGLKKHKTDSFFVLLVVRYVLFVYRFPIRCAKPCGS
jgi:hypothetical protein